ncbi:EAL domain-containing protein [Thalassospira marina]|uniref:Histidine kinase n=1 Tax=Thalassospira marina TaxID=2048283 RepID=A0A2N3KU77_9PROT|nr:EAL domain-containing protein [Thalassospira marina]PKR54023.1 histidine kinase [Thalassospira marina]
MTSYAKMPAPLASVRVGTLAQGKVLTCGPDLPLGDAITLMHRQRRSSIVVTEENRPVGVWTEHDCLTISADDPTAFLRPISDWMSSPVRTMSAHASVEAATFRMRRDKLRHLIIIDDSECLVGIVSQSDLIRVPSAIHPLRERDVASIVRRNTVTVPGETPIGLLQAAMKEGECDSAIVFKPAPVTHTAQPDGPATTRKTTSDNASETPATKPAETEAVTDEFGIVTERDIVGYLVHRSASGSAWEIASRPVRRVQDRTSLQDARQIMIDHQIRHLVVTDLQNTVLGILSFNDLLASIEQDYLQHMHDAMEDRDTALARAQKSLHLSRKIIESSPDGIVIVDDQGRIEDVNPSFTRVTGYSRNEAIGKSPNLLQSGRHDRAFYEDMWQSITRAGRWQGEIWNRRKSGEIYPEWLSIIAIRDEDGRILQYAGIFSDITDRKQTREDMRRLSHFDELTGFPNRRRFLDVLGRTLNERRGSKDSVAVLLIDIDNFQRINNTLGHAIGDDVLVDFAGRLNRALPTDATLARMGADDFAIMLPQQYEHDTLETVAQDLMEVFNHPHFSASGGELFITASMGITLYPRDGSDTTMLLRNAEIAMLRAKNHGRNRFNHYNRSMNTVSSDTLALESDLRHALERRELYLAYQPQFIAASGLLSGFEALIRWRHPKHGELGPDKFIPLAEEIGMIDEIGLWVLRTACTQTVKWRQQGLHNITMAVNASLQQFNSPIEFGDLVASALNETGLAGDRLEIEITESLFMQDIEDTCRKLQRISDLGVKIALDDFGTGFSSLSYLRHVPFDVLKIDRSFVNDIGKGIGGSELVRTIINMAHNLGKSCIAEGVENLLQEQFLRENGCDFLQGFLRGRPVPAEQIEITFADLFSPPHRAGGYNPN